MEDVWDVTEPTEVRVDLADVNRLFKYLRRVISCLEEDAVFSPAFETTLADKAVKEATRKFISDPQTKAIFIQRSSTQGQQLA